MLLSKNTLSYAVSSRCRRAPSTCFGAPLLVAAQVCAGGCVLRSSKAGQPCWRCRAGTTASNPAGDARRFRGDLRRCSWFARVTSNCGVPRVGVVGQRSITLWRCSIDENAFHSFFWQGLLCGTGDETSKHKTFEQSEESGYEVRAHEVRRKLQTCRARASEDLQSVRAYPPWTDSLTTSTRKAIRTFAPTSSICQGVKGSACCCVSSRTNPCYHSIQGLHADRCMPTSDRRDVCTRI